jgi:NADH-quinone oxidoreductase subunit J
LLLGAPFIAMAQVTMYAGAIMVLFLFVIMLLGAESLPELRKCCRGSDHWRIGLAVRLLIEADIYLLITRARPGQVTSLPPDEAVEHSCDNLRAVGYDVLFRTIFCPSR